jgi:putative transposase
MKQYYTAKELADAQLPQLPGTVQGLLKLARRDCWEAQQRLGKGGGYEYHISNLPLEARRALEARQATELLTAQRMDSRALAPIAADAHLSEIQRTVAGARTMVCNTVNSMVAQGVTQTDAVAVLLTQAKTGQLGMTNPALERALVLAKDSRGRGTDIYPSKRSILRWISTGQQQPTALAPKHDRPINAPDWANLFLSYWQRPEKPTIAHAYRQFAAEWQGAEPCPSVDAVRRFLRRVGNVSKQHGRMGPRELKNLLPFVRRAFDQLLPGDIYSADGHTFDAEVSHPLHGRPFRPEITTFIDIATRRAVGYSVDLAESSIAVLDALIDSCRQAVPAILYVDNGGGYENALLKDEAVGVLVRLGCEISHSLPYNSQARGVIERVHQTLWVDGAKEIQGYIGWDMDREAKQMQHKLSRKALKENGKTHLLGWDQFVEFCDRRMDDYNNRPHSSLPKITDAQGKRRHLSPMEVWQQHEQSGWQPQQLSSDEAARIFRPRVTRKALRGEIKLMNNIYFSHALTEYHGDDVQVAFDIHNAQFVWVYELASGREICKAEWNANQRDYMPMSYVEQAREKRADARLKRIDAKRDEIEAERAGRYALDADEPVIIPGLGDITALKQRLQQRDEAAAQAEKVINIESARGVPEISSLTPSQRGELFIAYRNGSPIPAEHDRWYSLYHTSKEFKSWARRNGHEAVLEEIEYEMGPEARTL